MWNRNERKGTVDQVKGRIKQATGALTSNAELKAEGRGDETRGRLEVAVGRVRRKTRAALARAGKAVKS